MSILSIITYYQKMDENGKTMDICRNVCQNLHDLDVKVKHIFSYIVHIRKYVITCEHKLHVKQAKAHTLAS